MQKYHLQSNPIIHSCNISGLITMCMGERSISSYFAALPHQSSEDEVLLFNPLGSRISLHSRKDNYELNEPGTFLMSPDSLPTINYNATENHLYAVEPLAVLVTHPDWWQPYTGHSLNASGYAGDKTVGIYKLSERKNPQTGTPTSWTNDSISLKQESAYGVLGFSYVLPKKRAEGRNPNAMIPIFENRPEESIHRHPQVSKYEPECNILGLSEFYIALSGKVGVGIFDTGRDTLSYHVLGKGEALRIDPEEIHGVLATSHDFQYLCIQTPSCYHYPFNYNKHQFSYVSEIEAKLGYDVIGVLLEFEEVGDYVLGAAITSTWPSENERVMGGKLRLCP
jgi:hypothetical protein